MGRGLDGFYVAPAVRFSRSGRGPVSHAFGGHSEGETPLPIPNRAVKPLSADGTWLARARESRSPPFNLMGRPAWGGPLCFKNRRRPTLPGPCGPSTIGAEGLNCSVRNGKRCFPLAIATEMLRDHPPRTESDPDGA